MTSDRPSVLVVDDSVLVRRVIAGIVESSGEFRLAGEAADGLDAIRKVHSLAPDLVTMDIQMPQLDGLQALAYIMHAAPRAVVMLTARESPQGGDLALRALELGAVDFVQKPGASDSVDPDELRGRLLSALRGAATVNLEAAGALQRQPRAAGRSLPDESPARRVVVIAASTGGPRALAEILPSLPPNLGAAVLVVQHMPAGFTASLASRLDRASALPVCEAHDGQPIGSNRIYVAPGGRHLSLTLKGGSPVARLGDESPILGARPSADLLFEGVASQYGANAVGVVLTGMGRDGAAGLLSMRRAGALALVQDEATATVYGMPRAALGHAGADRVCALPEMAGAIARAVGSLPQ